jgi:hypothetical protein
LSAIVNYLRDFYQKDFKPAYFLIILVLLGICIYINYWHALEISLAGEAKSKWGKFSGYYLLYFIPFAAAFFLQLFFFKDCRYYRNFWFWMILLLAPAFFSFRVNFDFHQQVIQNSWTGDIQIFWIRCLDYIVRVFVVLIPVFIVWSLKDRNNQPFYGTATLKNVTPYLIMLLLMIPLIALAGIQNDFLQMYPRAGFIGQLDFPKKTWHYIIFELCYGFDFISIEFFFRGFLILSLLQICGPQCIIPVACFYCSIHLGKPLGEAISSFWGGMLLGIISYNTKSIWGGLIVHLGIAWLMEACSFLVLFLKK